MDTNNEEVKQPVDGVDLNKDENQGPLMTAQQAAEATEKNALLAEAKALGLPANASWGIDAIKRNIDAKKAELAEQQAAEAAEKEAEQEKQLQLQKAAEAAAKAAANEQAKSALIEPLDLYIQRVERAHLDEDVFAVEVTHPEVKGEFYTGLYSGIRLKKGGKPSVKYSNGTVE